MQGLRDGNQIHRGRFESTAIRGRGPIFDFRVTLRSRDHGGTRVSRDDVTEPVRQRNACLARSRGAVPCQLTPQAETRQIGKQLSGIVRPVIRVLAGDAREVIGKRLHFRPWPSWVDRARWVRKIWSTWISGSASTVPRDDLTVVALNNEL